MNKCVSIFVFLGMLSLQAQAQSSFSKIDASGKELLQNATLWACVLDKNTGLTWEIKSSDPKSPHYFANTYRWGGKTVDSVMYFMEEGYQLGASSPFQDGEDAQRFDDWNQLIDISNSEKLCGHSNWRLPTIEELISLAAKEKKPRVNGSGPFINGYYFPFVNFGYWSSTAVSNYSNYAWSFYFSYGEPKTKYRGDKLRVMLVSD